MEITKKEGDVFVKVKRPDISPRIAKRVLKNTPLATPRSKLQRKRASVPVRLGAFEGAVHAVRFADGTRWDYVNGFSNIGEPWRG